MSSIASQRPSLLAQTAQADLRAIAADDGLRCLYRKWDALDGPGEEVLIILIDAGKMPDVLALAGSVSVRQPTHGTQRITLHVPRCADETELEGSNNVSPSGGIYGLQSGDTLEVPGWAANQPASETVKLRVPERIGLLGQATYVVEVIA